MSGVRRACAEVALVRVHTFLNVLNTYNWRLTPCVQYSVSPHPIVVTYESHPQPCPPYPAFRCVLALQFEQRSSLIVYTAVCRCVEPATSCRW